MSIKVIAETSLTICVVNVGFLCVQETSKPASENSLRILTAVIAGMKHWSQLKDKIPHLVEIFGQLSSCCCSLSYLGH